MKSDKPTKDGGRHVREFVATGQPDDDARAERHARRGPAPTRVSLDELVANGRTVIARIETVVRRVAGRFRRR